MQRRRRELTQCIRCRTLGSDARNCVLPDNVLLRATHTRIIGETAPSSGDSCMDASQSARWQQIDLSINCTRIIRLRASTFHQIRSNEQKHQKPHFKEDAFSKATRGDSPKLKLSIDPAATTEAYKDVAKEVKANSGPPIYWGAICPLRNRQPVIGQRRESSGRHLAELGALRLNIKMKCSCNPCFHM